LLKVLILSSLLYFSHAQVEQGIPSNLISADLNFTMGAIDTTSNPSALGFEMNFWGQPSLSNSGIEKFMTVCDDIELYLTYDLGNAELSVTMT
jgi:hypothetical protein